MAGEFSADWTSWLEDAYLQRTPEDPECLKYHYITRTEKDEPRYTVDEEIAMMNQQIEESEGFDIDYSLFRCVFNYKLVDPKDYDFIDDVSNEDLMKRLSQESLERYNQEMNTKLEFIRVVKANYHFSNGFMFLITFEASDPSDQLEKTLQARVYYSSHYPTQYVFCRLKPDPNDHDSDETSKEDVKE